VALNVVRAADVIPARWRNGGGWTRELLAWPAASDWTVRISVADIESDGPFSEFPGVDRWFAVVAGAGVVLQVGHDEPLTLTSASPLHSFAGESATTCARIDGPLRDVNVMVRRDAACAITHDARTSTALQGNAVWAGLFVAEACTLFSAASAPVLLQPLTLVWLDNPEREPYDLQLGEAVRGWWIELVQRDDGLSGNAI
jgi:environmental stress-induced protein Ves